MAISDWFKRSRKEKVLGEDAELWPHDEDELDFELETTPEHRGALESNPHLDALESDIDIFESTTETVTCTEIPEGDEGLDWLTKDDFNLASTQDTPTFEEMVEEALEEGEADVLDDSNPSPLLNDSETDNDHPAIDTSTYLREIRKATETIRTLKDWSTNATRPKSEWSKRLEACAPVKQETHVSPGSDRYQDYRTLTDAINALEKTLSDLKAKRTHIQKSYPEDDLLTAEISRLTNLLTGHYKPLEYGRENPAMSILNLERDYYRVKALEAEKELSDKIREHNAQKRNNWIARPAFLIASEAAEQLDQKIIDHINAREDYEVSIDHNGILPNMIAQLLKKRDVDTLKKLALMTTQELLAVPQIGPTRAETIVKALSKNNILCRAGIKSSLLLGNEAAMSGDGWIMDDRIAVHWNAANRANSDKGDWPIPGIMIGRGPNDVGLDFELNYQGRTYLGYKGL